MPTRRYIILWIGLFLGLLFLPSSLKAEGEELPKSAVPSVEITGANVICVGVNTTTLTVNVPPSFPPYRIEWNTGAISPSITVNLTADETIFSVTIIDLYDNDLILGTAQRRVYLTTPPVVTDANRVNDTLCPGLFREATVGIRNTTAKFFVWSADTVLRPDIGFPTNNWNPPPTADSVNFLIPLQVTRTVLTVQMSTHPIRELGFENACYTTDSAWVEVDEQDLQIIGDTEVCEGGFVTLTVVGAVGPILWSDSSRDVTSITVQIPHHGDTIFWADTEDHRGCAGKKMVTVVGLPVPKGVYIVAEDTVVCRGASTILTANCDDCESFFWTNNRDPNDFTEIWPRERFTYSVTAFGGPDQTGCSTTASIVVDVQNCDIIYFPTAIRLSAQLEENRIFRPIGTPNDFSQYYFAIFNRWGQLLFESHDLNVGWDGTYQGKNVRPGTYVFFFRLTNRRDVWERTGTVTVVD